MIVDLRRAYEDGDSRIRPPRFLDVNRDFSVEDSGETMGRQYDNPALLYAIQTDLTTHMDLLAPRRPGTLTTDGHLILTPRVYAYVLRSRKWCMKPSLI